MNFYGIADLPLGVFTVEGYTGIYAEALCHIRISMNEC